MFGSKSFLVFRVWDFMWRIKIKKLTGEHLVAFLCCYKNNKEMFQIELQKENI